MIHIDGAHKHYQLGARKVPVLNGVSLRIEQGEFVAIMGPSGSGKTTLLNAIGCLDTFSEGHYVFDDTNVHDLDSNALAHLRAESMGFVFQSFNLIPRMSAQRNVELPMIYVGAKRSVREQRAKQALAQVGLADRVDHLPTELSGGQQQRVAIARALVNEPKVLIADEPTGSLDSATGDDIIRLFQQLHQDGKTIVMVTHEQHIAAHADRIVHMRDGVLSSDEQVRTPQVSGPQAVVEIESMTVAEKIAAAKKLAAANKLARKNKPSLPADKPDNVKGGAS